MPEVPPPMRAASSTVTAAPACASRYATEAPITPAPITIVLIIRVSSGSKWIMARDHEARRRRTAQRMSVDPKCGRAGNQGGTLFARGRRAGRKAGFEQDLTWAPLLERFSIESLRPAEPVCRLARVTPTPTPHRGGGSAF